MPGPGKICAVPCCTNTEVSVRNAQKRNAQRKNITFHNFPSKPEIRHMWYKAINKDDDWIPRKVLTVCSSHFTPDSFSSSEKRTFLKRTAVPSVWGPVSCRKLYKLIEMRNPQTSGNVCASAHEICAEMIKTPPKTAIEQDCVSNPVSSDDEDIFHEEPVPEPIWSSASTRALGIDSSSSYEASYSGTQHSVKIELEDEFQEGFFPQNKPHLEDKYLVFLSQLLLLFKFCRRPDCQKPIIHLARKVSGTCLTVKTECLEGHKDTWDS